MKTDMMHDNGNDNPIPYHTAYGSAHSQMDPNIYPNGYMGTYSYYPHEGYQPLNENTLNMNRKNSMNVPYYDDLTGNTYGTAIGMEMMSDSNLLSVDPNLMQNMDPNKVNHIPYEDELEYSSNRNGRVIREIIV